jgi:anti-sigma-K factor RskA
MPRVTNLNPTNPELIDRLSSEYVLGTLRGPARRRFERWRESSATVDERCRFWEERLMPLAKGLAPIEPPAHVWRGIRTRLNLAEGARAPISIRTLALAASVLVVLGLGALLYWRSIVPGKVVELATISAPTGAPVWNVEIYAPSGGSGRMIVRTGALPAAPAGRDYELWALPKGGAPVSLGVLPSRGVSRQQLTQTQQSALANSVQVAVSLEPSGGSPTGQPTGAIVFVAPLRTVS